MVVATTVFVSQSPALIKAANVNAKQDLLVWHVKWKFAQVLNPVKCAVVTVRVTTNNYWRVWSRHVNAK
jgi:hypothetical protein